MWATKRRTKQAKIHHTTKVKKLSIFGGIAVVFFGAASYLAFLYFAPLPLLRPIPVQTEIASADVNDSTIEEIKKQLETDHVHIETISQTDVEYKIKIAENGEVLLSKNRNLPSQLASLQVIMIRLTMEGKRFSKLDMRFDKPVIVSE